MRIVFFIYSIGGGGAERVMVNLANYWAGTGRDITIVTQVPLSHDEYKLHPAVKRISLNLATESANALQGMAMNVRRITALRRVLRQIQPDIAIGFMTTANIVLGLAAWGLPHLITIGTEHIHPPMLFAGRVWEFLRKYTYGNLAAVTALSEKTAAWLQANTNARCVPVITNMAIWPLPVQEPIITPGSIIADKRRVALAAGRLSRQKGYDLLIDAFYRLADKYRDWDLVILGEGSERPVLERKIAALGLGSRVKLPGHAGNLRDWYERSAIFVLSSRHEGYPGVLTEAMVHGLPAVSFDCDTGPRDIIRPEMDGILVPNGDIEALSSAMERLICDPELRRKFESGALASRERFSIDRIVAAWDKLFSDLGVRRDCIT
jgi:glycosyltransferase involved in cell wall biosynthesis